jgi:hypothetical protein
VISLTTPGAFCLKRFSTTGVNSFAGSNFCHFSGIMAYAGSKKSHFPGIRHYAGSNLGCFPGIVPDTRVMILI